MPRITVVTPSYNQAEYLEETIRSVLLQGYPNLEYIIIDGGSTDGSVDIIRKYEPWLAYWVSEPDNGQSQAINKGWQRATGEICAYLNSDDLYLCHALNTVASYFKSQPETDLMYGDALYVDEIGTITGRCNTRPCDLETLLQINRIPQPSAFVKTTSLLAAGLLDENLHLCMDYDLWLRIAAKGQIGFIPALLAGFRIHSESKTTRQVTKMYVEHTSVASNFLARPDVAARLRERRDFLLASSLWKAGIALWFEGRREEGKDYIRAALVDSSRFQNESNMLQLAGLASNNLRVDAIERLEVFFDEFPQFNSFRAFTKAWTCALLARNAPSLFSSLDLMGIAVWNAPRLPVMGSLSASLIRHIGGIEAYRRFTRSLHRRSRADFGLPVSQLC